jgi:steroid delta-isomerase-like uncharacterized protein
VAGENSKAIIQRVIEEIFNQQKLEVADELFASDFVAHFVNPLPGQPLRGPEAVRWYARVVRQAFPDLHVSVEHMIAEDDDVASRVTWTGTHTGQFVYLPPTGKRIKVEGITMDRVAGDKLVEHWGEWNAAELMLQLGVLPGPEGTEL